MSAAAQWQGRSLARLFDDQSGCVVLRRLPTKCILRAEARTEGADDLFVKIYNYRGLRRLKALLGRGGARRELDHCRRLQRLAVPVPEPIGIVEERRWGVPRRSLYASRWVWDAPTLRQVLREIHPERGDGADRLEQLAFDAGRFAGELHKQGVACRDLHSGNLLVLSAPGRWPRFLLVDYERITFGARPSARHRLEGLSQLGVDFLAKLDSAPRHLCRGYAAAYGDPDPAALEAAVDSLCRIRLRRQRATIGDPFLRIAAILRRERQAGTPESALGPR